MVLLKIFKSTLQEFGLTTADLASGTTDSGSDVKALSVNGLFKRHGIQWDWCACHLMVKAAEQAFGVCADPTKSKNPEARDLLRLVIKVIEKLNKSANWKAQFDDLQTELLGEVFKIIKHAPQRWLSLARSLERIIRLWHLLRRLFSENGQVFPLDEGTNRDGILQLYSLLQPLAEMTRDGQYGGVPMTAEIHMKFGVLKMSTLDVSKDLKVFDIPEIEQKIPGQTKKVKTLPSKMVPHAELHPVAAQTRVELRKALVTRFYGRMWDQTTSDPSVFRETLLFF